MASTLQHNEGQSGIVARMEPKTRELSLLVRPPFGSTELQAFFFSRLLLFLTSKTTPPGRPRRNFYLWGVCRASLADRGALGTRLWRRL